MKSSLFYTDAFQAIEVKIQTFLNLQEGFLSDSTAKSTRAVGDAIQDILAEDFDSIMGEEHCAKYSCQFARRAMADLAFEDKDGFYYVVDVKTHRLSTKFNMPNLTSVQRLARFYEEATNYFVILMIAYEMEEVRPIVRKVTFVPIEFFGWDCLTIGALGWGQIQIANSNIVTVNPGFARRSWMLQLCDVLFEFYPKEIAKIDKRIEYFKKVQRRWVNRPDGD